MGSLVSFVIGAAVGGLIVGIAATSTGRSFARSTGHLAGAAVEHGTRAATSRLEHKAREIQAHSQELAKG